MQSVHISPIQAYERTLAVAPDKSITHRALLLGAVAAGQTRITNALLGQDCLHSAACMRQMGAAVTIDGDTVSVTGTDVLHSAALDAGNSGTTMRLLCGLLAGAEGQQFTLTGDSSLQSRPMLRVIEPLEQMGAAITAAQGGRAPLCIRGQALHGIRYRMPVASAQVKSALLLAGLRAEGETTVVEGVPSRDHTERMLLRLGASIRVHGGEITVCASKLHGGAIAVPGDISSAAYPMVLAACAKKGVSVLRNVGVNPTRTGILDVFDACGVRYELLSRSDDSEPTADIAVHAGSVRPFRIDGDILPRLIDEIPVLAVLACFAEGTSVIAGAEELKVKESNRIDTTANLLRAFGACVMPTEDGMRIEGKGYLTGGCTINPRGDHRIAMSAAVAAALSQKGAAVLDPDCAAVSYPDFFGTVV